MRHNSCRYVAAPEPPQPREHIRMKRQSKNRETYPGRLSLKKEVCHRGKRRGMFEAPRG
jgi:hypothetical protein